MKRIKYLLIFIFIFIINISPVLAQDFNVSNTITAPTCSGSSCSGGHYTALENYNVGSENVYTINTRYNGRLSLIRFNLPIPSNWPDGQCFSTGDLSYTLTLNMATDDWRNYFNRPFISSSSSGSNWATSNVVFVSYKKIYFNFKIPNDTICYSFLYVSLSSPNQSSVSFTGVSNWNLSNITLTANFPVSPTPVPTATPKPDSSNTDIINNQNSNTNKIINNDNQNNQNIIDNDNNNTNNIIENNNQNTQDILDSQNNINNNIANSCKNGVHTFDSSYNFTNGYELTSNGSLEVNNSLRVSPYLSITPNTTYEINIHSTTPRYYCWYRSNKALLSCSQISQTIASTSYSINSPYNAYYLRVSISNLYNLDINGPICNNWEQEQQNAMNDYLMDDSNPNISNNEFTSLFDSVGFNDPLSYLLQLPVQFINQLVSQSNTCQTINLGALWGVSLSLPCIDVGSIIGQSVWDIIDVLFSVGLLVVIFKNLYQTFANLMTLGGEKEAREKFSMPTPMEFLSMILGGDR